MREGREGVYEGREEVVKGDKGGGGWERSGSEGQEYAWLNDP